MILAILTVEGSYSQDIERPTSSVPDTVQFWYAPDSQWRIKAYAIDHDIHIHRIASADPTYGLSNDFAQANIQKTYGDLIERMMVLNISDPQNRSTLRQIFDVHDLTGELEIVENGYCFYNPDCGHYSSQTTPQSPSDICFTAGMTSIDSIQPKYPALHVHGDGSLGVLFSQEHWSKDVDQWFWGDAGDYIIDSEAIRFDQRGDRDGGRPLDVPEWKCVSPLSENEVYALAASAPNPKISLADLARISSAKGRIAFLIKQVAGSP